MMSSMRSDRSGCRLQDSRSYDARTCPGVHLKDIEDFRRLFEDDAFKPDMLKIYPTLVLKHYWLIQVAQ